MDELRIELPSCAEIFGWPLVELEDIPPSDTTWVRVRIRVTVTVTVTVTATVTVTDAGYG